MNLTKNLLVHHHQILKRPNDNLPTGQYRTTMFLKFSDHVLTKCFKFIIQTMKQPPSSRPFSIRIQNCAVQLSPLILPLYRSSASSGRYAPIGPCRCCRTQQGAAGAGRLHLSLIDMRGAFASVDGVCCSSLERGLQLSLILIRGFFSSDDRISCCSIELWLQRSFIEIRGFCSSAAGGLQRSLMDIGRCCSTVGHSSTSSVSSS